MSPIGRTFLVLNLLLAGLFVAFTGTYLKRADNYKQRLEVAEKNSKELEADLRKKLSASQDQFEEERRITGILTSNKTSTETKLAEAQRDNANLQQRLTSLEGSLKTTTAQLTKIADETASSRQESKAAMDRAIAAEKATDEATAKRLAAEESFASASTKINNMTEQIAEQTAQLAARDQKLREKDVILALVVQRYPNIFDTLAPLVTGAVSRIGPSGKMVTIALESGAENLKPGASFAIYSAQGGYKGEATVREVDSSKRFCFAKLSLTQKGQVIKEGDSASTNLSVSPATNKGN